MGHVNLQTCTLEYVKCFLILLLCRMSTRTQMTQTLIQLNLKVCLLRSSMRFLVNLRKEGKGSLDTLIWNFQRYLQYTNSPVNQVVLETKYYTRHCNQLLNLQAIFSSGYDVYGICLNRYKDYLSRQIDKSFLAIHGYKKYGYDIWLTAQELSMFWVQTH